MFESQLKEKHLIVKYSIAKTNAKVESGKKNAPAASYLISLNHPQKAFQQSAVNVLEN